MNVVLALLAAAAVSYLLRITFAVLVPPDRLPALVQAGLEHVGPAAMAALGTAAVLGGVRAGSGLPVQLAGVAVAGVVMWWRRSVGQAVLAALAAAWVIQLVR